MAPNHGGGSLPRSLLRLRTEEPHEETHPGTWAPASRPKSVPLHRARWTESCALAAPSCAGQPRPSSEGGKLRVDSPRHVKIRHRGCHVQQAMPAAGLRRPQHSDRCGSAAQPHACRLVAARRSSQMYSNTVVKGSISSLPSTAMTNQTRSGGSGRCLAPAAAAAVRTLRSSGTSASTACGFALSRADMMRWPLLAHPHVACR